MTRLVTSVSAPSLAEMRARVQQALGAGTETVELRLDHLGPDVGAREIRELLSGLKPGSWIATLRSAGEGGMCPVPAEARLAFLLEATAGCEGWIDFEYRAAEETLSQKAPTCPSFPGTPKVSRESLGMPPRLILSVHDFQGRLADVAALAREIVSRGPMVIAKVAWAGPGLSDNLVAFQIMRELRERVIAVVMGEAGLASRVLAKKFGAAVSYCALDAEAETAPGQVTLDEMLHLYRWPAIRPTTRWFGVLGDPVRHSMSPRLFNRMFEREGLDAVYLPLPATGGEEGLAAFLHDCEPHDGLDVGGFSVTLPHKQAARRFVGDQIEPLAARIGAVNTLVLQNRRFHGYNTDHAGALDALCHGLGCERGDLRGLRVDVLGAGGAARAAVAGLTDCGCVVTVFNRTPVAAAALAAELGCRSAPWQDRLRRSGQVVANCTRVGLWPQVEDSPLPAEALDDRPVVFDMVYNPVETRLLREARQTGCVTINGVEMFVSQAAAQYRLWFGRPADVAVMREIALQGLA